MDGRTDLFAFGVILYALMTGRDPWLGGLAHEPTHQIYELMAATDRAEVRPIHESGVSIPPAMVAVIMKLLRRNPDDRFQSARELLAELERVEHGGGAIDAGSIRALTTEPGVHVEIRSGREVVAEGATPCVVNGIPAGTYTIVVRDPLYQESETSVILGAGAMEDVTVLTTRRSEATKTSVPRKKKGPGSKIAAGLVLLLGSLGALYAQPWGRTVDRAGLDALIRGGRVDAVYVTDGGVEAGVAVAPSMLLGSVPTLGQFRTPLFMSLDEGDIPEFVSELSTRGVAVDASWEIERLRQLAVDAQARGRYYGTAGGDVQSYALRLAELDPDSEEAASLLRKVGERMAWDAEAALDAGMSERVDELVSQCLALVPEHPRCTAVAELR